MAQNYKTRLRRFNGVDWDTLQLSSQDIVMDNGNNLETELANYNYKIYSDVSQLNLSSPTINTLWNTLPNNSIFIASATQLATASRPGGTNPFVYIVKISAAMGFIRSYGAKTSSNASREYKMDISVSSPVGPTGEWVNVKLDSYPVGAIYTSYDTATIPESPASLFGGTWTRISEAFLYANSSDSGSPYYTVGTTGGETSHTLTIDEMPSHAHSVSYNTGRVTILSSGGENKRFSFMSGEGTANVNSTGGGQAHNNMPPFLVVCMWRRVS